MTRLLLAGALLIIVIGSITMAVTISAPYIAVSLVAGTVLYCTVKKINWDTDLSDTDEDSR